MHSRLAAGESQALDEERSADRRRPSENAVRLRAALRSNRAAPRQVRALSQIEARIAQYDRGVEEARAQGLDQNVIDNRNSWLDYWQEKRTELLRKAEEAHDDYHRDRDDLYKTMEVPLVDALTGFSFKLTHLDGKEFTVDVNTVTDCDHVMRVPGKGMPRRNGRGFGDLYLTFEVEFPEELTVAQKTAIRKILGDGEENEQGESVSLTASATDPDKLWDGKILMTIVGGKVVYRSN